MSQAAHKKITERQTLSSWLFNNGFEGVVFVPAKALSGTEGFDAGAFASFRIVFVNGFFSPALSVLKSQTEGISCEGEEGVLTLKVGAQCCLALEPVEILYLWSEGQQPTEAQTEIRVELETSARLTLIERHIAPDKGQPIFHASSFFARLSPQAKLVHGRIIGGKDTLITKTETNVENQTGAFYDAFFFVRRGLYTYNASDVVLAGELASARVSGVCWLSGKARSDTEMKVHHKAAHGTSRQQVRSVLDGQAKGQFRGRVLVDSAAQKTDAYQQSRALLLSDQAEMSTRPELEIYADDVKCSHGSTVGDLDEGALFYLRSRGINMAAARTLLVQAFMNDLVDQIQSEELAALVRQEIEKEVTA